MQGKQDMRQVPINSTFFL